MVKRNKSRGASNAAEGAAQTAIVAIETAATTPKRKKKKVASTTKTDETPLANRAAPAAPIENVGEFLETRSAKKRKRQRAEVAAALAKGEPVPGTCVRKKKKLKHEAVASGEDVGDESQGEDVVGTAPTKPESKDSHLVENTVFIDGLPYVWSQEKVVEFFSQCGKISSVRAPTWQDSGRLRGFAHVTFADTQSKKKALALDGSSVGKKGRYLKIEPAKAPGESETPSAKSLEGFRRLFVKNLPYDTTEEKIGELFKSCGRIQSVRIPTSFGRSKGFAYVEFANSAGLQAAIQMRPRPSLQGRELRLDADAGDGPKAGFHHRPEAYESNFGPSQGSGRGGHGKGGKASGRGNKGGGKGPPKMSLF